MFEGQGRGDVLIRVAVDTMGGDFGPPETVKGALEGLDTHNIELLLVGDQNLLESELAHYDIKNKPVKVVASVGKIGDDEHPIEGLRRKPKSSIVVATKLLKSGDADLLVSMGSTGASMASSVFILGLMDGLERPCIGGPFLGVAPRTVLVDMGSNIDCRPPLMLSFAALGSVFSQKFLGIDNPRVGLLSVGSEAAKGNRQVHESYQLLQESHLNFIGNVEGMDFFTGRVDVIVCDGFVGNILMKFTEGLGTALSHYVEQRLADHLPAAELAKVSSDLWETTNMPRTMGGPLFGVNGMVMLGHGSCRASGIAGAIHTGVRCAQIGMVESMRQELAQLSGTEVLKN
ncbi:MAG TPA: phosphate acyltransferase PlsX [Dehalococcoidia bacterium]|jgi:glycerol-3-phosphate acyltransferase PlsX|nr:MAG: phosphate acyltransferase PlsX [SAR202 cluster bacterium]HIM79692.1 phosphate acyltransferase PlsX [Dehalococcoidia bacterium]|tara:strand:+ start:874 stop:1908 length:1035 start_codon:yes stop_codon:yes gene_type:complete